MATPFDDDGRLDTDGAAELARWLCAHGNDGLVLAGTTGESPTLSDDEKLDLWRAVAAAVDVPILAGTSTSDTAHSVELTRQASAISGVTAILAVTPYYSRPSQAGLNAHFRAMAAATDLPVVLYDIPGRTGRKIAHETMVRLASEVPNIVGVKDAAGSPAAAAKLLGEAPPGFELYCGDDALTLPLLAVGAGGVVSVASHWVGDAMSEMVAAFWKGDLDHARRINARLIPSWEFEGSDETPNPMPAKAALRALGLPAGQCRLPIGPAPAELDDRAAAIVAQSGAAGA